MAKENTKKVGFKDVLRQLEPIARNLGGFAVGNLLVNGANKMLKIDPTDTTQKGLKKLLPIVPPVVVTAGGAIGAVMVKNPMIKDFLIGAAISGAFKTTTTLIPASKAYLGGDGLGLTPVSAVSNSDRWLYHESTPVSGMGFPNLGTIQPPEGSSGYYLDPPAYMGEPEYAQQQQQTYFRGANEEQFYGGGDDDLSGQDDELDGSEDIEIL